MRSLCLLFSLGAVCLVFAPACGHAQAFEITSLSGSIEGRAYSTLYTNGTYPRYGKEYALTLAPENGYSISASIDATYSVVHSDARLAVAALADRISFVSTSHVYSTPMGDPNLYSQEKLAAVDLILRFTVLEPTLMQLTFDVLQQNQNNSLYTFYGADPYSAAAVLTLRRIENGIPSTLATLNSTWDWVAKDSYGEDDGVFYASTLLPGVEYELDLQSWSNSQGQAVANGALNFSSLTPVPEPAGALLLMLGLALLAPRSRRLTA